MVAWMALRNRLATKDRMARWYNGIDSICPFCKGATESVEHLFFACSVTSRIWSHICHVCGWNLPNSWSDLRDHHMKHWSENLIDNAKKLAWSTTLYHVWKMRNSLLHAQLRFSELMVAKNILLEVKLRLNRITKVPDDPRIIRWCTRLGLKPRVKRGSFWLM